MTLLIPCDRLLTVVNDTVDTMVAAKVVRSEQFSQHTSFRMSDTTLRLSVSNCRAIRSADIALDGISVLAGVNASGKSTISRLFHSLISMSEQFPDALKRRIWKKSFSVIDSALMQLKSNLGESSGIEDAPARYWNRLRSEREERFELLTLDMLLQSLKDDFEKLVSISSVHLSDSRVRSAAEAFFRKIRPVDSAEIGFSNAFAWFNDLVSRAQKEFQDELSSRNYESIRDEFINRNQLIDEADSIFFFEGENLLFSSQRNEKRPGRTKPRALQVVFSAKNVCYIESPQTDTLLFLDDGFIGFASDPSVRLACDEAFRKDESLFRFLSGSFDQYDFDGSDEDSSSDSDNDWWFHRKDGESFPLSECATGIRALSVLNILYTNGCLNSETVLILDEPEAHLHPQWIVDYAQLLTLIAKRLGVRILIASHSPHMIRALREFGLRNLGKERIRFYLAEPDSTSPYQFNFADVGTRIAPVFKVFNVALDKVALYGES